MKKIVITLAVAVAAIFAFSSCQKENFQDNGSASGVRTISAEFESKATKTTLNSDGITPEWEVGDNIRILSETTFEDITLTTDNIENDGRTINFNTSLIGTLYAVYPASATTMESCPDGNITFTLGTNQDGTFASANICVAKSTEEDETNKDNLIFRNATAVLEFSQTATDTKVLSIRVEAANAIVGPMSVSFNADGTLDTPTTSSLSGKLINAKSTEAKDKYYVAVAPVTTGKIEFEYQKAVEVATVTTDAGKTLAVNKIYACSMDEKEYNIKTGTINGHDYVQVGSVRWATMNVGATTVATSYTTCYGDLYEWGSVETIYNVRPWTSANAGNFTDKWKTGKTNGYSWTTYCGNSSFQEWDTAPYDATTKILTSEYDAATQNWGTGWRMPTSAEFNALYEACGKTGTFCTPTSDGNTSTTAQGIYWCTSYDGVAGLLFITKDNGPRLFFPAAGRGSSTSLLTAGSNCYYWSSSLGSPDSYQAYRLDFKSNKVNPQNSYSRYYGCSVRPVSD